MGLFLSVFEYPGEIEAAWKIRREVFVVGQNVTEEEEIDGLDPECLHLLAEIGGEMVGASRMRDGGDGVAKAERVAVLKTHRRRGVGRALMQGMELEARRRGYKEMLLGAQVTALEFYSSLEYVVEGDEFLDARIPHRWMRKSL